MSVGNFGKKKIILDFGCGLGEIKKLNIIKKNKSKIINYDLITRFGDVKTYKNLNFDTIIFCQVLYLIAPNNIAKLLSELKRQNKYLEIIVAYSTQSIINKVFAFLLGHSNAHKNTLSSPKKEREVLLSQCYLIKEINYLNLFKIMLLKFK